MLFHEQHETPSGKVHLNYKNKHHRLRCPTVLIFRCKNSTRLSVYTTETHTVCVIQGFNGLKNGLIKIGYALILDVQCTDSSTNILESLQSERSVREGLNFTIIC